MKKQYFQLSIYFAISFQIVQSQSFTIPLKYEFYNHPIFYAPFKIGAEQQLLNFKISLSGQNFITSSECDSCTQSQQKYKCDSENKCVAISEPQIQQDSVINEAAQTLYQMSTIPFILASKPQSQPYELSFNLIIDTNSEDAPEYGAQISLKPETVGANENSFIKNMKSLNNLNYSPNYEQESQKNNFLSQINFCQINEQLAGGKTEILSQKSNSHDSFYMFIDQLSIFDEQIINQNVEFTISTESSYIELPLDVFNKFVQILQESVSLTKFDQSSQVLIINNLKDLENLQFKSKIQNDDEECFNIEPINFVKKNRDNTYQVMIKPSSNGKYTMGLPLFYQYYVSLHYEQIQVGLTEKHKSSSQLQQFSLFSLLLIITIFIF